jgi:flagellin
MNAARNLSNHYSSLSTSVSRLSSGLRVRTAADDAAGLAIRELMRAEIAAFNQGMRNANDAISMIQTADGALGVIDEKLIRMKELAEQAATGTYNSDQRLMIESEYQAMAAEITRIANATDFNGIHLLNGNLESIVHNGASLTPEGKIKIHFGSGNDAAEDYYYIAIGDCTAAALGLGSGKTADFAASRTAKMVYDFAYQWYERRYQDPEKAMAVAEEAQKNTQKFFNTAIDYTNYPVTYNINTWYALTDEQQEIQKKEWGNRAVQNLLTDKQNGYPQTEINNISFMNTGVSPTFYDQLLIAGGSPQFGDSEARNLIDAIAEFAGNNFQQYTEMAGTTISTQEAAQIALDAVNNAIAAKDNIRAHLGAMQNRLENTISNLAVQAENLQAAESRISDVDVALEMTNFVRQQILSQAAVAMLGQANSLPQMALQLISG